MGAAMAAISNRRLRQMAEIDEKLAEFEGFSDYIKEYEEATAEFNEEETDDPDFLMNLERERQEREHEGLKGTLMEPALVICWLVIAFVTLGWRAPSWSPPWSSVGCGHCLRH